MCTNELNDRSFGFPGGIQGTKSGNKLKKKQLKKFREIDFTEKINSLLKISIKVMFFLWNQYNEKLSKIKNCKQTDYDDDKKICKQTADITDLGYPEVTTFYYSFFSGP